MNGPMKRRKGEAVKLYCEHCAWSTEISMAATEHSHVFTCEHCDTPMYWHRCPTCGLGYAGAAEPSCPSCDDASLDDIRFD
jgi:hypothetical protein